MAAKTTTDLWFDSLPPELFQAVLTRLLPIPEDRESYYPCLHLAETSPTHRRAVLTALSYKLTITRRLEHLHRWAALFATDLRELDISTSDKHAPTAITRLLKAPTLRRVNLIGLPTFLRALANSPALAALTVTYFRTDHEKTLISVLPTLAHLTELRLFWSPRGKWETACHLSLLHPSPEGLASCCPHVSALELDCRCPNASAERPCIAWPVAAAFPSLHVLTIHQYSPNADDIALLEQPGPGPVPVSVPQALLDLSAAFLHNKVIVRALVFPPEDKAPTEHRHLVLSDRFSLVVPCATTHLFTVRLEWQSHTWFQEDDDDDDDVYRLLYHEPYQGAVLRAITAAPYIASLCLMGVRITVTELTSILRTLGPRLSVFGTAVENQDEMPDERLSKVMQVAAEHCRSLDVLVLDFTALAKCTSARPVGVSERPWRIQRLALAYNSLRYTAPHLEIADDMSHEDRSIQDIHRVLFGS